MRAKKIIIPSLILLLLEFACHAQRNVITSISSVNGNKTESIDPHVVYTDDNGFIIRIGSNSTTTSFNSCLTDTAGGARLFRKYSATGILQWEKCSQLIDTALWYLFPLAGGGFIEGGYVNTSIPSSRIMIRKENSDGSIAWAKHYGGINGGGTLLRHMIAAGDGGYFMVAESFNNDGDIGSHYGNLFTEDIWIIKLDSTGSKVWSKVIGGTGPDVPSALVVAPGGGCYIVGTTGSNDFDCTGLHGQPFNDFDGYVVRIDSSGGLMWHKCLGGTSGDGIYNACSNGKGGLLLAAGTYSTDGDVHNQKGNNDFWIVDLDSNGVVKWDNCFGSPNSYEIASGITRSSNGSIWIIGTCSQKGGHVDTTYGGGDAWVLQIDGAGNFINSRVLGTVFGDDGNMIAPLQNGSVFCGGTYSGYSNNSTMPPIFWGQDAISSEVFLTVLSPTSVNTSEIKPKPDCAFVIYPNPATDIVTLTFPNAAHSDGMITIVDIEGRTVIQQAVMARTASQYINVNKLSPGLFLVCFENEQGIKLIQKLCIL